MNLLADKNPAKDKTMKKLLQISIILVLALALIVGLFQIGIGTELPTASNACRVGWNTRTGSCLALGIKVDGPIFMPNVGWNS
jgi:hypothetical protein